MYHISSLFFFYFSQLKFAVFTICNYKTFLSFKHFWFTSLFFIIIRNLYFLLSSFT
uniref:Candidate secreted effector n=1 Tax=Meloidogyne incognita TaxID=6306 RepID=A0A914NR36_MELIC